jgi:hypothetical protein
VATTTQGREPAQEEQSAPEDVRARREYSANAPRPVRLSFAALLLPMLLVGCDALSEGLATASDAAPDAIVSDGGYLRLIPIPLPPMPTKDLGPLLDLLPKDSNGKPILFGDGKGTSIVLDTSRQPTAGNTLSSCRGLISWCIDTIGKLDGLKDRSARKTAINRARDVCWISVPKCTTDAPWNELVPCCPAVCVDAYESARREGDDPSVAQDRILFKKPRCIPGLDTALGEGP